MTVSVVDRFQSLAAHAPDRAAYSVLPRGEGPLTTWSFAELDLRARRVAGLLRARVEPGARVLLVYPPGLDFMSAFLGCLYAGAIAVPVPPPRPNQSLSALEATAKDCGASMAMTTEDVLDRLRPRIPAGGALARVSWSSGEAGMARQPKLVLRGEQSSRLNHERRLVMDLEPPALDSVAYLQYTSGSTGAPKGVMVSHANLAHNLRAIAEGGGSSAETVAICWLPLYHDMGLVGSLEVGAAGGHTIFLPPLHVMQRPARWLQAISTYRASRSGAPSFFYDLCARTVRPEERDRLDLSAWDVAVVGAETVRAATLQRFAETFAPARFKREALCPSYGLAESTVYVTGTARGEGPRIRTVSRASLGCGQAAPARAEDDAMDVVSCGRPRAGQVVMIVDPGTRTPQPEGSVGEIWTHGGSVAQGYWARPDETRETFHARLPGDDAYAFLRTGDLGFLLDGELFVTARLKDAIIIRGANYAPEDIEQTSASAHPDVEGERAAAFSTEIDGQERLVIVQEVRRLPDATSEDVSNRIREAVIAEHGILPERIVLVKRGVIPRTTSGKIRRQACRAHVNTWIAERKDDDR